MSQVYRVYIEEASTIRVDADDVCDARIITPRFLADKYFASYTIIKAEGHFAGKPENSLIIEVIGSPSAEFRNKVYALALDIKVVFNQETVLITEHEVLMVMV